MRKFLGAALFALLFGITILPALANPTYVAADNFTRSGGVGPGWGTSRNSVSATNYAWAGDLATDAHSEVLTGYGIVLCGPCTVGQAFSGTLGPSGTGGTTSATFVNLYAAQEVSVAEDATTDLTTAYLARVNYVNGKLEIVKRVSSVETVLSSTPLPRYKKTWLTVTLTVNGSALSASAQYRDGIAATASTTDSSLSPGYAGVYVVIGTAQHFDEVMFSYFSHTHPTV